MPSRHAAHGQCMRSICGASFKGVGCVCSADGPRMPPVRGTCAVRVRYVDAAYVPHTCRMWATRLEHSLGICTTYAHPRPPTAWLSATPVKPPTPWARHTGEVGRETESLCGRFASTRTDAELLDVFRAVDVVGEQLPPSYNVVPPSRYGWLLHLRTGQRRVPDPRRGRHRLRHRPAPRGVAARAKRTDLLAGFITDTIVTAGGD